MTRTKRIEPVQRLMDGQEKDQAQVLARARTRLAEAEAKLAELARYRGDYERGFREQAAGGLASQRLRDYRLFLARLDEALRQQQANVQRLREELEAQTRLWQEAARRSRALGVVVERWRGEERLAADRQEQRDTDERASGMAARRALRPPQE